jgi:hypothetical protein
VQIKKVCSTLYVLLLIFHGLNFFKFTLSLEILRNNKLLLENKAAVINAKVVIVALAAIKLHSISMSFINHSPKTVNHLWYVNNGIHRSTVNMLNGVYESQLNNGQTYLVKLL